MNKKILILILIFSMLFSGCSNLIDKTEEGKFKGHILQQNLFQYSGQINEVDNISKRVFKANNKYPKFFSLVNRNIINALQGKENVAAIGILGFKKVITKIIRKHFLKHIDRKKDRQHRKRNLLILQN